MVDTPKTRHRRPPQRVPRVTVTDVDTVTDVAREIDLGVDGPRSRVLMLAACPTGSPPVRPSAETDLAGLLRCAGPARSCDPQDVGFFGHREPDPEVLRFVEQAPGTPSSSAAGIG